MDEKQEEAGKIRPKKRFGQNFLTSQGALRAITEAGDVKKGDLVLEIGPGKGALTAELLAKGAIVIATEKDRELIGPLQETFAEQIATGQLTVTEGDILDLDVKTTVRGRKYKLIANIPYYITGQIIRKFLETEHQPGLAVLLVQKEVAERIVAKESKESILSISVKAYAKPRIALTVKAGSFFPKPKVDSAVLVLHDISRSFFKGFDERAFFALVRAGFAQKRKLLLGNLAVLHDKRSLESAFDAAGIPRTSRAEDVGLERFAALARALQHTT